MGVVNVAVVLSSANWTASKPADYKSTALEQALKAWDAMAKTQITIPKDMIPQPPACKVAALKDYAAELKKVISELDKGNALVNQFISGLGAVQAAGGKTAAELTAAAKAKGIDENKAKEYTYAAGQASSIASAAASAMKAYQ